MPSLTEIRDTARNVRMSIENAQMIQKETIYQRYDIPYKIDEKEGLLIDYDRIPRDDPKISVIIQEATIIDKIFRKAIRGRKLFSIDLIKGEILIKVDHEIVYQK